MADITKQERWLTDKVAQLESKIDRFSDVKPYLYFAKTTTDATATDIGKILVRDGETVGIVVETLSTEYGQSGERGFHIRQALFYRDAGGNVILQGAVSTIGTDIETDVTMGVTLEADTAAQTIDIKVTGVIASNIKWRSKVSLVRFSDYKYKVEG